MKNIYEVKVSKFEWGFVLAGSASEVDAYCKENNLSDWRSARMLARCEYERIRATAKTI